MEAKLYEFIRTDCHRKAFNDTFENEHKKITNCCDLCDRSLPVPSTSIKGKIQKAPPQWPIPKFKCTHRPEQELEAKKRIQAWRSAEFQELKKESEIYSERCIMNNEAINLLSSRFSNVTTAKDINSIIKWSELIKGSQQ